MQLIVRLDIPHVALLQQGVARRILQEEIGQGVTLLAERIATHARENAPVDRGILRASIFTRVTPGHGAALVEGLVATGRQAPYAEEVERGTPPHWIDDIDALKGWAKRKLGDANRAYAVRRAIAQRGTRPQPYMEPAMQAVAPQVDGVMQRAIGAAARRLEQTV